MTNGSPLRRKIDASKTDAPLTPSLDRIWRRAVTHGIGRGLGLGLVVDGVDRSVVMPESAVDLMSDGMLAVLLDGPGTAGIALMDVGPLTAIIEQQTRGGLGQRKLSARAPTAIDAALAADTIDRILAAFDMMTAELGLTGTVTGYRFGTRIAQSREISMALQDAPHDLWRIDVTFPQSETRAGSLRVILPHEQAPELADQTPMELWSEKIERRIMGCELVLRAELGKLTISADTLRGLTVDQTLTLPRKQINAVTLAGPGGFTLGRGRLGQSAGYKALRIEPSVPEAFRSHLADEPQDAG